MIHNLSYPCNNSVNDFIDHEFCSVRYSSIDDAVKIIQRLGRGGKLSKCDIKSAFRLLRIFPGDFDQLGFVFQDKYYFDKCLPFGASISCALFEKFSTALHWFTEIRSGNPNILHYLDDSKRKALLISHFDNFAPLPSRWIIFTASSMLEYRTEQNS
jgi:hypothetical protein